MSAYGSITANRNGPGEGPGLTQSVNREYFGLDRFGLISPPYLVLETIRNQTLPRAITDERVSHQGGSAPSAYLVGKTDVARRATLKGISDDPRSPSCLYANSCLIDRKLRYQVTGRLSRKVQVHTFAPIC